MLVFWRVASCLAICTVDARSVLSWCLRLVKCMSWYLSGAKVAPCLLAHAAHLSWAIVRRLQFSAAGFSPGDEVRIVYKAERKRVALYLLEVLE